jgi:hypothetical protein
VRRLGDADGATELARNDAREELLLGHVVLGHQADGRARRRCSEQGLGGNPRRGPTGDLLDCQGVLDVGAALAPVLLRNGDTQEAEFTHPLGHLADGGIVAPVPLLGKLLPFGTGGAGPPDEILLFS